MRSTEKIDRICYELTDHRAMAETAGAIESADELYLLLDHYNWDDGYDVPTAIANHPACDLAIAIRLYWLASADEWFESEAAVDKFNQAHYDFSIFIAERILSGAYQVGELSHSEEFNRVAVHQFKKSGLPEIFYRPVVGKNA